MRVDAPEILELFRLWGRCPGCLKMAMLVPHHCLIRCGHGGGSRLDVCENLLSVCVLCNNLAESSRIMNKRLQDALIERLSLDARRPLKKQEVLEWLWTILWPQTREIPARPWAVKEAV